MSKSGFNYQRALSKWLKAIYPRVIDNEKDIAELKKRVTELEKRNPYKEDSPINNGDENGNRTKDEADKSNKESIE